MRKLLLQGICKIGLGIFLIGVCVFLPAGTMWFPNGWLMMGIMFVPMILTGCVLVFRCPEMLKIRLLSKEEQHQKLPVFLTGLMFLAGFIAAGLDRRFMWSHMPGWVSVTAAVLYLAGYMMYLEVMRENRYVSRTVQVAEGQSVVQTGLYAWVRHPMYSATIVMFLSLPLVLGSWYAFLIFMIYPILINKRAKEEEIFLKQNLSGYEEYLQKVRRRFIPFGRKNM